MTPLVKTHHCIGRSACSLLTTRNSIRHNPYLFLGVIDVPQRFLMGPGPANADPRILAAQTLPLLGHL